MKFVPADEGCKLHRLELSRRNLEILLRKLDDPLSGVGLVDPDNRIIVGAVETHDCLEIVPVENEAHYSDRAAGSHVHAQHGRDAVNTAEWRLEAIRTAIGDVLDEPKADDPGMLAILILARIMGILVMTDDEVLHTGHGDW
jgi:hypothetical protein